MSITVKNLKVFWPRVDKGHPVFSRVRDGPCVCNEEDGEFFETHFCLNIDHVCGEYTREFGFDVSISCKKFPKC